MQSFSKRQFLKVLGCTGLLAGQRSLAVPVPTTYESRPRLMQGPMLGYVVPDGAAVWVRASETCDVTLVLSLHADFHDAWRTEATRTERSANFTATLPVRDLEPATTYFYRVLVNDELEPYQADRERLSFRTAPGLDARATFTVAFGSCARYAKDPVQRIWNAVGRVAPDLFFWLGDNVYGDTAEAPTLADEYERQRGVPSYHAIAGRIPQLATWDDHDYAFNDSDRTNPVKERALQLFKAYWANPAYGQPGKPGVYFHYAYGGVDFYFLDVRFYRDPNGLPDIRGKTMLGEEQKRWLKQQLAASRAPFKVLVSGSGWSMAKGPGGDSWASCRHERDELFDFIRDEEIAGVVLLSGDTHVGELNAIPRSEVGGYDLYDLVSSPLAQPPSDSWIERTPERRIRQAWASTPNFGFLRFDLRDEPTLSFDIVDDEGNASLPTFELRASELRNGVATWHDKMDRISRHRYDRAARGEPYYQ
jgi:alkaline phosphatase D